MPARAAPRWASSTPPAAGWRPSGIAHIVGAGPGDPDLLTLRAAQLLQEADAILHDDLVPPAILARARRDAELVSVGKRKGRASWAQADINAELVRRVRAGQTVVRLKAGDPFVFGRGGEEVEALARRRPAGSRRAGHHRGAGLRGLGRHSADPSPPRLGRHLRERPQRRQGSREAAWPALAAQGHTLAIYMGATEAASVRDRLLGAGADPTTPVAIVENGTRPDERVSTGRLADLARLAAPHTPAATPVPASSSSATSRRLPPRPSNRSLAKVS